MWARCGRNKQQQTHWNRQWYTADAFLINVFLKVGNNLGMCINKWKPSNRHNTKTHLRIGTGTFFAVTRDNVCKMIQLRSLGFFKIET